MVPKLVTDLDELPPHLRPDWDPACWSSHSPQWWRRHWERSALVEVERADMVPEGWAEWPLWLEVCRDLGADTDENEIREWSEQTLGETSASAG